MGCFSLSSNTTSARLCMALLVVLGLVLTVALFQGTSWSQEKVDDGLTFEKHNSLRKLLMFSMGTVTNDYDGDGDTPGDDTPGDGGFDTGIGDGDGNGTISGGIPGIGISNPCTSDNIALNQGPTAPLPNGIPTWTVIIENICMSGCSISDIHFKCEWFASARTINPSIFRRLEYDDCLVNDGNPLQAGASLSFQYANSFPYKLTVSKLTCL